MKPNINEQRITCYEEGRRLANIACWSIELQICRLTRGKTEIPEFVMQPIADFHFLLIAINRLRRAADLVNKAIDISPQIDEFDQTLPGLIKMRNIMEHIDNYWQRKGHDPSVSPGELPNFAFSNVVAWCGEELDLETVRKASSRLFQAIQDVSTHAKHY